MADRKRPGHKEKVVGRSGRANRSSNSIRPRAIGRRTLSGCWGIPYLSLAEIEFMAQIDRSPEIK
jgi:hypothetical protein